MYFLVGQQRTERALTAWSAREVFQGRVNSLVFTHAAQFVVGLNATDEGIGRQSSSPKYRSTMNNLWVSVEKITPVPEGVFCLFHIPHFTALHLRRLVNRTPSISYTGLWPSNPNADTPRHSHHCASVVTLALV